MRREPPEGFAERLEDNLKAIEERLPWIDRLMFDSAVFRQRSMGVGLVPREWADGMAITGPPLRAMGVARDVRKDNPYEKYGELCKKWSITPRSARWFREYLNELDMMGLITTMISGKGVRGNTRLIRLAFPKEKVKSALQKRFV